MSDTDQLTALGARGLVEEVSRQLNERLKLQQKIAKSIPKTGEIRQKDLLNEFGLSPNTLKQWHDNGLTPIYRGGGVYYLLEDLHRFNY